MRLFCFAYAGGTASFYSILKPYLDSAINLDSMEYAGHGTRRKEPCYHEFTELVDDLYPRIQKAVNIEPYALMGYSMGCIAVAEILNKILVGKELPPPVHVFLAAHEPHTKSELQGFSSGEMDELVKERTLRFGGIPEQLIRNQSFWRMYLPVYRADYSMIGRYDFDTLKLKTCVPATIFYSEEDTPFADMEQWKKYFVESCNFRCFEGGHFFIQQHSREIAAIISERLLRI